MNSFTYSTNIYWVLICKGCVLEAQDIGKKTDKLLLSKKAWPVHAGKCLASPSPCTLLPSSDLLCTSFHFLGVNIPDIIDLKWYHWKSQIQLSNWTELITEFKLPMWYQLTHKIPGKVVVGSYEMIWASPASLEWTFYWGSQEKSTVKEEKK